MQRVGTRFLGALKYGGHSGAEEGGEVGRVSASSPSALFSLGGVGGGGRRVWEKSHLLLLRRRASMDMPGGGCSNKIHETGDLNNRNAVLTVLESRLPAWSGSGEGSLLGGNKKKCCSSSHYTKG